MSYAALADKKAELIRKARDGSVFIAPYSAMAITAFTSGGTSEVQSVTITGVPTGGTFTLTYGGQTTAAIAYNATAADVQTALEALSTIGAGNVTVAGGPGPDTAWTVTFDSSMGDVQQMTGDGTGLTGGTTPAVAVTTTTPGTSIDLAPLPSNYEDLGWTTTDGVTWGRSTNISNIQSFGSVEPTRADVTQDTITMQCVAQETKKLSIGLYTGADVSNLMGDPETGEVSLAKPDLPSFVYYRVFAVFLDTDDSGREIYMARFMPRARITELAEQKFTSGDQAVEYSMTFTGYNDSALGYSHKWYWGGAGWKALLAEMGL